MIKVFDHKKYGIVLEALDIANAHMREFIDADETDKTDLYVYVDGLIHYFKALAPMGMFNVISTSNRTDEEQLGEFKSRKDILAKVGGDDMESKIAKMEQFSQNYFGQTIMQTDESASNGC